MPFFSKHDIGKKPLFNANKCEIDVITSQPNRYKSFKIKGFDREKDNITVYRINIPSHKNGMIDQVLSFQHYFTATRKWQKTNTFGFAYPHDYLLLLGYTILNHKNTVVPGYKRYFVESISEVITNSLIKGIILPVLKEIEQKPSIMQHTLI